MRAKAPIEAAMNTCAHTIHDAGHSAGGRLYVWEYAKRSNASSAIPSVLSTYIAHVDAIVCRYATSVRCRKAPASISLLLVYDSLVSISSFMFDQ